MSDEQRLDQIRERAAVALKRDPSWQLLTDDIPWMDAAINRLLAVKDQREQRIAALEAERDRVYAAKQQADRDTYDARNEAEELRLQLAASEQRAAALVETLEWYAEERNYDRSIDHIDAPGEFLQSGQFYTDRGRRARKALAAAAPSDHECRVMTRSIPALCVVCAKPKEAAATSAAPEEPAP